MQSNKSTKNLLCVIVKEYKRIFPQEYSLFCDSVSQRKSNQHDDFGGFSKEKSMDFIERAVGEWPDTLNTMIKMKLPDDDYKWFRTKPGTRWFVKRFPEFAAVQKV